MAEQKEGVANLYGNISKVIVGKKESIILTIATMLCRGNLLIDDAPGLAKTMLARTLARSLDGDFKRIQCTPDLLPSDITGVNIFNPKECQFHFVPGPAFTNILLADEINRTTPRTQSALLESMEEHQVSIDGKTYPLPEPFMLIATQNPIEFTGTYPLPEAQLDRFFMRIAMGYPTEDEEIRIMEMQAKEHPVDKVTPVMALDQMKGLQEKVCEVTIEASVNRYITSIVRATRSHKDVALGASPRGSVALMKASQALAMIAGRDFVTPQQVKQAAKAVLAHRLVLKQQTRLGGKKAEQVVEEIVNNVAVPV